ncbi:MAG TPA: phosphatase PAP2 family protein [Actinomycetes bacterium]|nr:phosphatase PAP2 family protein [Actinomycetes bacterium]
MPQLRPSFQLSVTIAALLAVIAVASRPVPNRWAKYTGSFAQEFTIVMLLLALWQKIGGYAHTHVAGAFAHARGVMRVEHDLHIPSEQWVQHLFLPYPDVVRSMNVYYLFFHLNGMAAFLIWVWVRHHDWFARIRNVVALTTFFCFLIQIIPVAPPRMLPGFVDTAQIYHQSVYDALGSANANELAAMPSVHAAWSLIIAFYAMRITTSRWRFITLFHWLFTWLVIVATANHWWLDCFVAAGLLGISVAIEGAFETALARRRATAPAGSAEPEPVTA